MFDKRNPVARWCWLGRENACHEKWKIRSILCGYKFNSHGTGHIPNKRNGFLSEEMNGKYLHPDVMEIYIYLKIVTCMEICMPNMFVIIESDKLLLLGKFSPRLAATPQPFRARIVIHLKLPKPAM